LGGNINRNVSRERLGKQTQRRNTDAAQCNGENEFPAAAELTTSTSNDTHAQ